MLFDIVSAWIAVTFSLWIWSKLSAEIR